MASSVQEIDDLFRLNAFLARVHGIPISAGPSNEMSGSETDGRPKASNENDKPAQISTQISHGVAASKNNDTDGVWTPAHKSHAPQTTPAGPQISLSDKVNGMESNQDDQTAALIAVTEKSPLRLEHSHYASFPRSHRHNNYPSSVNKLNHVSRPRPQWTDTQLELLRDTRAISDQEYVDRITTKFKEQVEASQTAEDQELSTLNNGQVRQTARQTSQSPPQVTVPINQLQIDAAVVAATPPTVECSQVPTPSPAPSVTTSSSPPASHRVILHAASTDPQVVTSASPHHSSGTIATDATQTGHGELEAATELLANKIANVRTKVDNHDYGIFTSEGPAKTREIRPSQEIERSCRQRSSAFLPGVHAQHDESGSKARTIILSHLPPNCDLSFVQGLIHGGAIETMRLCPAENTAIVDFTNADACEQYFALYLHGLHLRHRGKMITISVAKAEADDNSNDVLLGSLQAGATRVIRIPGADHDWSTRALYKLAEGQNGRRAIEQIVDHFRNEVRTIVFRFSSISDAIEFRQRLLTDPDWDYLEIQFGPDPCEKAMGIHIA